MLRKLLKHEFRATARIMLPLYLVLLVTAVGANITTQGLSNSSYQILRLLGALLAMAVASLEDGLENLYDVGRYEVVRDLGRKMRDLDT